MQVGLWFLGKIALLFRLGSYAMDAQLYEFCSYQVICGLNYGKHRNQCLLLNKHHSLMRIWLCKLKELKTGCCLLEILDRFRS